MAHLNLGGIRMETRHWALARQVLLVVAVLYFAVVAIGMWSKKQECNVRGLVAVHTIGWAIVCVRAE